MTKSSLLKPVLLLIAGSFVLAGCVVRETRYSDPPVVATGATVGGEVVVNDAPPAPIEEEIAVSPGPDFIWIPGVWVWHGRWVWERGRWGRRPHPGAVWVPHRYVYRNGVHVFVRGGWR